MPLYHFIAVPALQTTGRGINLGNRAGPSTATTSANGGPAGAMGGQVEGKPPKRLLTEDEAVCERRERLGEEEDYLLESLPTTFGWQRRDLLARLNEIALQDGNLAEYQRTGPMRKAQYLRARRARHYKELLNCERKIKAERAARAHATATTMTTTTVTSTSVSTAQENALPDATIFRPYTPTRLNMPQPPAWVTEFEAAQDTPFTQERAKYV